MCSKNNIIKFEIFTERKYILKNYIIVLSFIILFLIFGIIDNNLFLPNQDLGLCEHSTIWIFFIINLTIPFTLCKSFKTLEKNTDHRTIDTIKQEFKNESNVKSNIIILNFIVIIGFCCFVGNSLQNAHIINPLPFDYWDSIDYIFSYIISRIYKLYLFSHFIPIALMYIYLVIKSVSKLLELSDSELKYYPIKDYMKYNYLCDFGLNILLAIVIPLIIFSSTIYFVHKRLDIVTITTLIITSIAVIVFLNIYMLLINKFYISVIKYKKEHIQNIDLELSKIHDNMVNTDLKNTKNKQLEMLLKKEKYLRETKERINNISKYPLMIKALFTILSPLIPTFLKFVVSIFKSFF